jgi:glycosyltransferase involved in cell wall biosynthesis
VLLRNAIVPLGKAVIANSDAGAMYWRGRTKKTRVVKIPNIIPYEELHCVKSSAESAGCVLVIGRLDANKNVITLLRAVEGLRHEGIRCNVLVVGDGEEAEHLKSFVDEKGMGDRISFLGCRDDVWALMKGSRAVVSLSYYEGEPNVVLDAWALGCRLVLSDIPAHRAIEGLRNVTFVNPHSEYEVAEALVSVRLPGDCVAPMDGVACPKCQSRSGTSVCGQHLAVFAEVLSKQSFLADQC